MVLGCCETCKHFLRDDFMLVMIGNLMASVVLANSLISLNLLLTDVSAFPSTTIAGSVLCNAQQPVNSLCRTLLLGGTCPPLLSRFQAWRCAFLSCLRAPATSGRFDSVHHGTLFFSHLRWVHPAPHAQPSGLLDLRVARAGRNAAQPEADSRDNPRNHG